MVTRTGLESESGPVVSGCYGDADGDGRSSTASPDASGCVPTATDDGDSEEPPSELLELPAPALELPPEPEVSLAPELPAPTPELFITAGAIVADRAAHGRAERWKVEEILRRAVDQAGALRGEAA
jgi:hypothetical protein